MFGYAPPCKPWIDLATDVVPNEELICRAAVVAFIKHMNKGRIGEVTLAYIETKADQSVELVLIECDIYAPIDNVDNSVRIGKEPL